MSERKFKLILGSGREEMSFMDAVGCPKFVPWSLVAPHEAQAYKNHDQTLERLNERGGLSPREMLAVITDREWRQVESMPLFDVVMGLRKLVEAE